MRFNESEIDYKNWLHQYDVSKEVLKEIKQTYTELYDDLFNNSENLSKHKDKWIIFKVNSVNNFKDLFDDLEQIKFIGKDFKYSNFKLEKEDDNNPVYSADKTATADIIGRDGKTVMQPNGELRRAKNLSLSTLRSQLNSKLIKWLKEPELYDYYIKITRDVKEITHMSTDKQWDSCMKILKGKEGAYSDVIIDSIKNGLLVAYVYKTKTGDFKSIDSDKDKFANNAIARISINPFESNSNFLYLKAMKRYAGDDYLNNEPFDLQDEVQDYLDKHYNFGVLDTEDIFYPNENFYDDLDLDEINLTNDPFVMVENDDIRLLKKYIKDGKDLTVLDPDEDDNVNLLDKAIMNYANEKSDEKLDIIKLLRKHIPLKVNNKTLKFIIREEIKKLGENADLNHLDVSNVTDMSFIFTNIKFQGDISKWDTSNVNNMKYMFYKSEFNGDISKWDVSNVTDMSYMFSESKFNNDISKWNVGDVLTMACMFIESDFNQDISNWNVSNVLSMVSMFAESKFNKDISNWNVGNVSHMRYMFYKSKFNQNLDKWNVKENADMNRAFLFSPLHGKSPVWFKE